MKKLALALVCLVSVAFFASCQKEVENPEPSISIMTGEDYVYGTVDNPQIISLDDETNWKFGFHVEANAETKKELASLSVKYEYVLEGVTYDTTCVFDLTGNTSYDFTDYVFEQRNIVLEATITATVTDADNKTNIAAIAYKIDMPAQPLEEKDFSWFRHGGNPGQGLEEFGLEWTNNAKEIYCVIKPVAGAMLYSFTAETWNEVSTDIEKAAVFSEALAISDFRGVSAWTPKDYDYVIGTLYNGEYHLIHITRGDIETSAAGTDITISGQYK